MRVFEEREIKQLNSTRKDTEHLVVQPPRSLFKVVVNNYRHKKNHWKNKKNKLVKQ
jgi:hypothetical protein